MEKLQFKLTVGAAAEIAELCPDKDLAKIEQIMSNYPDTVKNGARFIRALNRGYVMSIDPMCKKNKVVTEAELLALEPEEFMDVLNDAMMSFGADKETSIEAEPKKDEAPQEKADL